MERELDKLKASSIYQLYLVKYVCLNDELQDLVRKYTDVKDNYYIHKIRYLLIKGNELMEKLRSSLEGESEKNLQYEEFQKIISKLNELFTNEIPVLMKNLKTKKVYNGKDIYHNTNI